MSNRKKRDKPAPGGASVVTRRPKHETDSHAPDVAAQPAHLQSADRAIRAPDTPAPTQTQAASQPAKLLTRLEKEFERLSALGPPHPCFSKSPFSSAEALAELRSAHKGKLFEPPSQQLLDLIRSGRLVDVGWALPRPIQTGAREEDIEDAPMGAIVMRADGSAKLLGAVRAPELASYLDFTLAIPTILAALLDQPAALSQWFVLINTVTQMDGKYGWPAARFYLKHALQNAVLEGRSIAQVDADLVQAAREASQSSQRSTGRANSIARSARFAREGESDDESEPSRL
jgi:hypothetical protein